MLQVLRSRWRTLVVLSGLALFAAWLLQSLNLTRHGELSGPFALSISGVPLSGTVRLHQGFTRMGELQPGSSPQVREGKVLLCSWRDCLGCRWQWAGELEALDGSGRVTVCGEVDHEHRRATGRICELVE